MSNYVLINEVSKLQTQIQMDQNYRVFGSLSKFVSLQEVKQKIIDINQEYANDEDQSYLLELLINHLIFTEQNVNEIKDLVGLIKDGSDYMIVYLFDIINQFKIEERGKYFFIGEISYLDNGMAYMIPSTIIDASSININNYYEMVKSLREQDNNYVKIQEEN